MRELIDRQMDSFYRTCGLFEMLTGFFWYRKGSDVLHPVQMMKTILFLALLYGDIRSAVCSITQAHTRHTRKVVV